MDIFSHAKKNTDGLTFSRIAHRAIIQAVIESIRLGVSTGNADLDAMLRSVDIDIRDPGETLGGPVRSPVIAKHLVGILSSEKACQIAAIKTVLNARATLLFVASDKAVARPPALYRWTLPALSERVASGVQGKHPVNDVLDAVSHAILSASGLLSLDAFTQMLAGQFIAVPLTYLKPFFEGAPDSLCVQLVGHGQTVGRGSGLLRQFDRFDAASLAAFLVAHIFRFARKTDVGTVWIKLLACKQLMDAEDYSDETSFVGQFLQTLSAGNATIASRTIVMAATCLVGFPAVGFMPRDETLLGTFPLTLSASDSQRLRFDAWQSFALCPMPRIGRASIFRFPAMSNTYSPGERGLLGAYLAARRVWTGWSHGALPDRFSLLGLLGNLKLNLTDPADIDVVLRFLTGLGLNMQHVSRMPDGVASAMPFMKAGRAVRASDGDAVSMEIDHGQVFWRSNRRRKRRQVDPYLLQARFVFAKVMTDAAVAAYLPPIDRHMLHHHDLSGANLVDEQIFRWIGAPPDAASFIARWKTRWTATSDVSLGDIPSGYVDGATLATLCRMAIPLLDIPTMNALAHLLQPGGTPVSAEALKDVLDEQVGVHPDGSDQWRMHRASAGRSLCRPIVDVATWERLFGEIGFRVGAQLRPNLLQIDRIRYAAMAHVESLFGVAEDPVAGADGTDDAEHLRDATAYVKASRALRDARRLCTR